MSLTNLLLRVYISVEINENKPLFFYNSIFWTETLRRDIILVSLKKRSGEDNTLRRQWSDE